MNGNLFEIASKEKYRYPFKGSITTEALWDLTLDELEVVYKNLCYSEQKKDASEDSLPSLEKTEDGTLTRKIAILRHIFSVKKRQTERDEMISRAAARRVEMEAQIEAKKAAYLAANNIKTVQNDVKLEKNG